MTAKKNEESFAKLRDINKGVPDAMVEALIAWLYAIGSTSDRFRHSLEADYYYMITPSPNAPIGGIQVWCNQDSGCVNGPGITPNHELWRNSDGTFSPKTDLTYG